MPFGSDTFSCPPATVMVGYESETVLSQSRLRLPPASVCPWTVNLAPADLGLLPYVEEQLRKTGLDTGRVDIALAPYENHARLTVNEYELLLMHHDVAGVLRTPFRLLPGVSSQGPDGFLQAMRVLSRRLGLSPSCAEPLGTQCVQGPPGQLFRIKRKISLLVSQGRLVQGVYQRPILVQGLGHTPATRTFDIRIAALA